MERIYGIKQGNNQHNEDTTNGLTQEDLAQKLGINLKTLQRAKSLANLSPEIQQLIEHGNNQYKKTSTNGGKLTEKELKRIYGIREGSAGNTRSANGTLGESKMTEKELVAQLGIGLDTLKRAKSLATLPKEIQDLVENGSISASTATRLVAKLSPKQAKNRQRQIHTVIKSVTPTEYNNSNKEIKSYTFIQILVFR